MKKVLVTGGAGFIGSHLAEALVARGKKVVVVDNLCEGKIENLQAVLSSIEFAEADVCDREKMAECMDSVHTVFHLAALKSVPGSLKNPEEYNKVNIGGTLSLLEAALEEGVSRVVFSSSSSVYGDSKAIPKKESMCPAPLSPYALTKLAGEHYLRIFSLLGLDTVSLRYFNVFGPRQDPKSEYAAVIPKFTAAALKGKQAVIYGNGEQTRDFTFVEDVVAANISAAESNHDFCGAPINVAGGKGVSINRLLELVGQAAGAGISADYKPERPGDIKHSLADISLAEKLLSWKPQVNLQEGLLRTVEFFKGV